MYRVTVWDYDLDEVRDYWWSETLGDANEKVMEFYGIYGDSERYNIYHEQVLEGMNRYK